MKNQRYAANLAQNMIELTRQLILAKFGGKCEQMCIPAPLHINYLKDAKLEVILHWWDCMKGGWKLQKIKQKISLSIWTGR